MAGNTKRVESTKLIRLVPDKKLKRTSLNRVICSRHLVNSCFILSPNEYTLLNFLMFMFRSGVIKYSIVLLKQYDAATSRMIELYGTDKVHYSTSRDIARNSFISLIERGYLIRLKKNDFMINPMLLYPALANPIKLQEEYLEVIASDDVEDSLSKWCNKFVK